MKKRVIEWMCFYLAVLAVLPLTLGMIAFLIPPQYDETYLGGLRQKKERLEEIQGRKLIVVGGSSVAFGIRSDLMEDKLGMPAVNWGLYAPLGSRTMLEACFDEIGAGDIVVFCPEQNPETLSFSFQAEPVWQAMDGDFSMLGVFRESELKQLLGAFPGFAVSKLKYALCGKPEADGIYQRDSFNEYGDIISAGREGNQMAEGYDAVQTIDLSFFPDEEFIQYLNEYASRVRNRGAEFYYRFCPMNEPAVVDKEKMDEWFLRLESAADFTILGNPHQCVMESSWFFDTNFHLNAAGAVVNTYYFIRDIKAQLKDPAVTDIELPDPPAPLEETADGDNSDAFCFLYEPEGVSLVITGVTEEGAQRKELTFPREYDGKKVAAVRAGSLEACKELGKVNVYGGITLYDGCFGGCRTLRKIVLRGKPSEITAGRELLTGSNAMLYTEYAQEYRLDYSWGLYSDKIKEYDGKK
ncbi:hypothetical protein [Schaedlerella sp.]|uniref:hypothetical protein n=1 Tax=Schaedlerella sp. TaxID=2676057 RepID=UPI003746D067